MEKLAPVIVAFALLANNLMSVSVGIPHKGRLTVQTNCDNTHWENAYNYAATVGTNDVLVLRRPACASAMQVRLVLEVEP